jgi:DNA repair exonuclease SbcCD ATPase subunit
LLKKEINRLRGKNEQLDQLQKAAIDRQRQSADRGADHQKVITRLESKFGQIKLLQEEVNRLNTKNAEMQQKTVRLWREAEQLNEIVRLNSIVSQGKRLEGEMKSLRENNEQLNELQKTATDLHNQSTEHDAEQQKEISCLKQRNEQLKYTTSEWLWQSLENDRPKETSELQTAEKKQTRRKPASKQFGSLFGMKLL